jgi:hypothetical protein
VLRRQNLVEADESDRKLQKLVDDNATAFAALGLGTLPGRDSGKQVHEPGGDVCAKSQLPSTCTPIAGLLVQPVQDPGP